MLVLIIISLVVSFLTLITLIVFNILNNKRNKNKETESKDYIELITMAKELNSSYSNLKSDLVSLKDSLPLLIGKNVSESMLKVETHLNDQTNRDAARLNAFQESINRSLQLNIEALTKKIDDNLLSINNKVDKTLSDGFKGSSETMANIKEQLGAISEAQKNIKSLSDQVLDLKGVLTNNQQRGRYGELQLEIILEATFGETKGQLYDTQKVIYQDNDGQYKPDAVIYLRGDKSKDLIAIDSKFSLIGYENLFSSDPITNENKTILKANFKAALKKRINETSKYIIQGLTVKNAIMFIPNDGIFAFIENEYPDLVQEAIGKGVVLACPTILQPMIVSFKVVQDDAEKAKNLEKINKSLDILSSEFKRFSTRWNDLLKATNSLKNKADDFNITVTKIDNKFNKITKGKVNDIDEEPISSIDETKLIQ